MPDVEGSGLSHFEPDHNFSVCCCLVAAMKFTQWMLGYDSMN